MKLSQCIYKNGQWSIPLPVEMGSKNTICFAFFGPEVSTQPALKSLKEAFPEAIIVGCTGAGEISGDILNDNNIVATIVQMERSTVKAFSSSVARSQDSAAAGERLAKNFSSQDLRALYVISEGITVNGTELMRGIRSVIPPHVVVSGGLAGDGTRFKSTKVLFGDVVQSGQVVAIGFYGQHLVVGAHAKGGWVPFGPERKVTKATDNILFELDGRPALGLYKEFLGDNAKTLPASALNFPLVLGAKGGSDARSAVRTILGVDEANQSMTFAGDIPEGETVRFMRSSEKTLIEAALECAKNCATSTLPNEPALSLMVSCVGRRIVLGTSTEDEIAAVYELMPRGSVQTGFYSYGELAPGNAGYCDLHNQTVTLTWIQEKKAA